MSARDITRLKKREGCLTSDYRQSRRSLFGGVDIFVPAGAAGGLLYAPPFPRGW